MSNFYMRDNTRIEDIRHAFEDGMIDEKSKISNYLNLIFERHLPERAPKPLPIKSGSTAVKEIFDYIRKRKSDRGLVEEASQRLSSQIPSLDKSYTSPSGFFKIHYTLTGKNSISKSNIGNNVPEYIRSIGTSFDYSKKVTCELRGFRNPILESSRKTMDVYVYDLQGIYGITMPTSYYGMTSSKQRRASCSISIDNNYSPSKGFKDTRDNCMKVSAAHEFFHAVQYAYNVDADSWWKEASATWNEDEVYGNVNDYVRYISSVFSNPEKPLEKTSYGGVVFAKYLSEHLGGYSMIKKVWDVQGSVYDTSIKAIDIALKEKKGLSIGEVFKDYAASNFNPSQYYEEGAVWKQAAAVQNSYSSYPVSTTSGSLKHLSANYQLFTNQKLSANDSLKIKISGHRNSSGSFIAQCRNKSDGLCTMKQIDLDGKSYSSEIEFKGLGSTYSEICLVASSQEKSSDNLKYEFSAELL